MSALGRLKAKLNTTDATSVGSVGGNGTGVPQTQPDTSVSFVGGPSSRVLPQEPAKTPFGSFGGDRGIGISENDPTLVSEIPLPDQPTEPTKALLRAELRNSLRLYLPQTDLGRCFVCDAREDADNPFVPVLTAKPGYLHWLHRACLPEHTRRILERVDAVLAETV